MRRKRMPPERGWRVDNNVVTVEHTDVDNIVTTVEKLFDFSDLTDQDEDTVLAGQDKVADYYVETVRGHVELQADPASTNLTTVVPVWWGFLIGDTTVLDDLAGAAPNAQAFAAPFDTFRAFDFVRQVCLVRLNLAMVRYGSSATTWASHRMWFQEYQLGQIHLRRGEGLYAYASQTGSEDQYQVWVGDDKVDMNLTYSALIRKKRSHQ